MAPNRREEIKQKQELQARFQFSISQNNALALHWLKPASTSQNETPTSQLQSTQETDSTNFTQPDDDFMKLRVIPQGSGLSSKATQTVGDFLNSKDIITYQKNKDNDTTSRRGNGNGNGKGSVAMNALLNKMRNDTRKELSQSRHTNQMQQSKSKKETKNDKKRVSAGKVTSSAVGAVGAVGFDSDSDSDDDDIKAFKSRSVSKISYGKVGKKLRPF